MCELGRVKNASTCQNSRPAGVGHYAHQKASYQTPHKHQHQIKHLFNVRANSIYCAKHHTRGTHTKTIPNSNPSQKRRSNMQHQKQYTKTSTMPRRNTKPCACGGWCRRNFSRGDAKYLPNRRAWEEHWFKSFLLQGTSACAGTPALLLPFAARSC